MEQMQSGVSKASSEAAESILGGMFRPDQQRHDSQPDSASKSGLPQLVCRRSSSRQMADKMADKCNVSWNKGLQDFNTWPTGFTSETFNGQWYISILQFDVGDISSSLHKVSLLDFCRPSTKTVTNPLKTCTWNIAAILRPSVGEVGHD